MVHPAKICIFKLEIFQDLVIATTLSWLPCNLSPALHSFTLKAPISWGCLKLEVSNLWRPSENCCKKAKPVVSLDLESKGYFGALGTECYLSRDIIAGVATAMGRE
jgi:hypothetical protein